MRKPNTSTQIKDTIVEGMLEKKAQNVLVLDLRHIPNAVADFFIICSADSDRQVDAIAQSVEKEVATKLSENPWHQEGKENCEWVVLDYVDAVAHVFRKDRRDFYALENLWGDAPAHLIPESQTDDAPRLLSH